MKKLIDYIRSCYPQSEYPVLADQWELWSAAKPLSGVKILDGTPVFRNTLVKYAVLLAAGADLTISVGKEIPCDQEIISLAPRFGIRVADREILQETFDAVADCAGRHKDVISRFGYAELTRSGLEYYRDCMQPVFSVDSGILKRFETTIGTGESFVRAMNHLGHKDFNGKTVVVFGGGKVGKGSAFYAALNGAETFIIDRESITPPEKVTLINSSDRDTVCRLLRKAWCIVSATGLPGALAEYVPNLLDSDALIVNMGVEDEFGPALPSNRVLNNKQPLNFILDEPTRLRCIDPSMALSNAALLMLVRKEVAPGINLPPLAVEMQMLESIRRCGMMNDEIAMILKECNL
ncbi:MAG: hypothetical protein E7058_09555 [Lentisphaerae bacterium]|nr:hypothetical protein [Lentisphaerota bacterium]